MTRDEAVAFIKFGLGNRTGTELDNAIVDRLKQAQRLLERGRSLPYFLKTQSTPFVIPAGSSNVDQPVGFLREYPRETFRYIDSQNKFVYLKKLDHKELIIAFNIPNDEPGPPVAYAMRKSQFAFAPTRDIEYTLQFSYYVSGGSLDGNTADNLWLVNAPDVLIGRAGALIAEVIAHDRAKAAFDQQFMIAWNGAFADGLLRDEENYPLAMGSKL